jgi:hypothetical protein
MSCIFDKRAHTVSRSGDPVTHRLTSYGACKLNNQDSRGAHTAQLVKLLRSRKYPNIERGCYRSNR